jgi:hypothetical protein
MGYDFSDCDNVYHPYGTVDDVQVLLNQTHDVVGLGAECGIRSWDYQTMSASRWRMEDQGCWSVEREPVGLVELLEESAENKAGVQGTLGYGSVGFWWRILAVAIREKRRYLLVEGGYLITSW